MKYQDNQHFSHHHILRPLVLNEGEELQCQACEQPIVEPFHGCISCNFYLHESCLNAPRSLLHPSHSSHPLTLIPTPTYSSRSFTCNACGSEGRSCSLSCAHCDFDLHLKCAFFPQTVLIPQHQHDLNLIFDSQVDEDNESSVFVCDICHGKADQKYWLYYCADCDFGTHLECGISKSVSQQKQRQEPVNKPEESLVTAPITKSPVRKTKKKTVKNAKENTKTKKPIAKSRDEKLLEEQSSEKSEIVGEEELEEVDTQQLSVYQAQRRLKEQHIKNKIMLQALDNAASYVGPSTTYYYY